MAQGDIPPPEGVRERHRRRPHLPQYALDGIFHVDWDVEVTDEWLDWWDSLTMDEQVEVAASVGLLEKRGPHLPFPFSSRVRGSRHSHMRELRVQIGGRPFRILYAFDPRRVAILLIGGDKTGIDRWYDQMIPLADALYDEHLDDLQREGLI